MGKHGKNKKRGGKIYQYGKGGWTEKAAKPKKPKQESPLISNSRTVDMNGIGFNLFIPDTIYRKIMHWIIKWLHN